MEGGNQNKAYMPTEPSGACSVQHRWALSLLALNWSEQDLCCRERRCHFYLFPCLSVLLSAAFVYAFGLFTRPAVDGLMGCLLSCIFGCLFDVVCRRGGVTVLAHG